MYKTIKKAPYIVGDIVKGEKKLSVDTMPEKNQPCYFFSVKLNNQHSYHLWDTFYELEEALKYF